VPLIAVIKQIDVVHVANPPDFLIPIISWLKLFGKQFAFDIHDLSIETFKGKSASKTLLGKAVEPFLKALELLSIQLADVIITTNRSIFDHVRRQTPDKRIYVVRNSNALLFNGIKDINKSQRTGVVNIGYFGVLADDEAAGLDYYAKTKRKAVRVDDRDQLIEEYTNMTALIDPSRIVVQEMIGGGPRNLYSYVTFFDGQRSLGGMTARRLRQHPMDFGHATTYAESVDVPEIAELGDRLLRKMQYWGVAEVEFMKDEKTNVYKFIEVNGRFWGWHTLARAAGINFPQIVYNFMHGVGSSVSSPVIGVKWIRAITDIPTVAKEMICGRLSLQDYIGTIRGKKEFAVFSIRDPLPSFVELVIWPYLWVKRGF